MSTRFKEEGFLSDDIRESVQDFYVEYHDWVALYYDLNRFACSVIPAIPPPNTGQKAYALNLYYRALTCYQSIILLVERGADIDAKALMRGMLEAIFSLRAVIKEEGFAETLVRADEATRLKNLKKAREAVERTGGFRSPEDLKALIAEIEKLEKQMQEPEWKGVKPIHIATIAEKAGMSDTYLHDYPYLCAFTHGSPTGLSGYLKQDTEKKSYKFYFGPIHDNCRENMAMAMEFLIMGVQGMEALFSLSLANEGVALQNRLIKLGEQLNPN